MKRISLVLSGALLLFGASSAQAVLLNVDQFIYQGSGGGTTVNPALLSGTIDVTSSGSTLTILLRNTSPDNAFVGGGAPATMLLTGFGLQLPGLDIVSGTVSVNGGSTALNFDVGQSATNISNQWEYANGVIDGYSLAGVLAVDSITSSVHNGASTRFAGPPPVNADGPGYGALSASETQFGTSTPGVNDTIKFVLTLNGTAPSPSAINAGNVVLAFGSPDHATGVIPEPSAVLLFGVGSLLAGAAIRRRS